MDDRELGRRIAYWRERRGMTQQLFADRIGRSYSWVTKVETGARSADRLAILDHITEVLRIDRQVLLGQGLPRETQQCIDNPEVEAIRAALERYDAVAATLHTEQAQPADVAVLQRQVSYVWQAFESGDYAVIGRTLPQLITDTQLAHANLSDTQQTARLLAEVYQLAASTLRKLGEYDLAWLAGDRGIPVAEQTGDTLLAAAGGFRVANALLDTGRGRAAFDLNVSFANRIETLPKTAETLSVYGHMLLQAGMAAARSGDARTVRELFREVQTVADHVGSDRNDYHTAFGPTNVGVHRVAAFIALGEGGTAVEAAVSVGPDRLRMLRPERAANHLVDVARGHSQAGARAQALHHLLQAERRAASEVRCRPAARHTISDLMRRAHPSPPLELRQLAERSGVAA